jgi:hypothetical protein
VKRRRRLRRARRAGIGVERPKLRNRGSSHSFTTETTHHFLSAPGSHQSPLPLSHPPCIGQAGREACWRPSRRYYAVQPPRRSMERQTEQHAERWIPRFLIRKRALCLSCGSRMPPIRSGPPAHGEARHGSMADLIPYSASKAK